MSPIMKDRAAYLFASILNFSILSRWDRFDCVRRRQVAAATGNWPPSRLKKTSTAPPTVAEASSLGLR